MTTAVSFSRNFYNSQLYTRPPRVQTPAAQASRRIILSGPEYQGIFSSDNFRQRRDFTECQQQYKDILNRITRFTRENADQITPPLSQRSINTVKQHFDRLKNHLTNPNIDFFGNHKDIIYGPGKELFHELDDLLQDDAIPLQKRMNAVVMMAPSMPTCSGGVLTAVQEAISSLSHSSGGVKGAAYRTKLQMMDSLISQHVRDTHRGYGRGNEVHYVNAYFNYLAEDMGVPARIDQFTRIAESQISIGQFEKCRDLVLKKLNPNALTKTMASNYLDQVKGAQAVDVSQPLADNELTDVFRRNQDIQQATLNSEFGEVPQDSYLLPVADTYSYQFAKQPTLIAKHFMETLKDESIVNYDDAVTLSSDETNGAVKMLGDLFWRDRDGSCEELGAKELLSIPPQNIQESLNHQVSETEAGEVFSGIAQHIYDSRDLENIQSVPDAWLQGFAELYNEDKISKPQITPVLQLATHFECPQALGMLLLKDVDTEIQDPQGNTLLMLAAQDGKTGVVSQLLRAGASSTAQNAAGEMPLMLCSKRGHAQTVLEMLQHEPVYINHQDRSRCTALMHAAKEGHIDTLIALLGYSRVFNQGQPFKADLTLRDMQGRTAQQIAEHAGHGDAARLLQMAAFAPEQAETALMEGARQGHARALQLWIQRGAAINILGPRGMTPLMLAVEGGHADAINVLLQHGANPNHPDPGGKTALHMAVGSPVPIEAFRALLDAGADPNAKTTGGLTPLMRASLSARYLGQLVAMIEGGANQSMRVTLAPDYFPVTARGIAKKRSNIPGLKVLEAACTKPRQGENLLMMCTRRGHTEALRAFIEHGRIDINAQNPQGMSAVMLATDSGRMDAMIALLDSQRADLSLRNHRGETAEMMAQRKGHGTAARILGSAARDPQRPLMICASEGHLSGVQALLKHSKQDINAQAGSGFTALNSAALRGHTAIVKALLEGRADPDRTAQGMTALMMASMRGDTETVKALIASGANRNLTSGGGNYTAAMYAARSGHVGTLNALIEAKVDLTLRNMHGQSADQIAETQGHHEAVAVLEKALFESWCETLESGGDLENHPWTLREEAARPGRQPALAR